MTNIILYKIRHSGVILSQELHVRFTTIFIKLLSEPKLKIDNLQLWFHYKSDYRVADLVHRDKEI